MNNGRRLLKNIYRVIQKKYTYLSYVCKTWYTHYLVLPALVYTRFWNKGTSERKSFCLLTTSESSLHYVHVGK